MRLDRGLNTAPRCSRTLLNQPSSLAWTPFCSLPPFIFFPLFLFIVSYFLLLFLLVKFFSSFPFSFVPTRNSKTDGTAVGLAPGALGGGAARCGPALPTPVGTRSLGPGRLVSHGLLSQAWKMACRNVSGLGSYRHLSTRYKRSLSPLAASHAGNFLTA